MIKLTSPHTGLVYYLVARWIVSFGLNQTGTTDIYVTTYKQSKVVYQAMEPPDEIVNAVLAVSPRMAMKAPFKRVPPPRPEEPAVSLID